MGWVPSMWAAAEMGCTALEPCTKTERPFAKLVAGTVSTAIAAMAIRMILLACFIFLPSKWNWPLGREENKESAADSELEGNARQTKQRRLLRADHTQNAGGTVRFETLSASEASLDPLKDWGALA
jgi:hypothetical protein